MFKNKKNFLNKVIWFIGTPFSGSTILGQALNDIPDFFTMGEIDRLPQLGMHPHLPNHSIAECFHCSAAGKPCMVWTPDFVSSLSDLGFPLYEKIAMQTGCKNVVDTSKTPYWFLKNSQSDGIQKLENRLIVVHCVRNPLAYADSLARKKIASHRAAISEWIDVNASSLYVIGKVPFPVPVITVRHENFLKNPQKVIEAIKNVSLQGNNSPRLSRPAVTGIHDIGGNLATQYTTTDGLNDRELRDFGSTIEHIKSHGPLKSDDRWKHNLSIDEKRSLMGMHGLWDLVKILGLEDEIIDGM